MSKTVEYHSTDFDLNEWKEEASMLHKLPEITEYVPSSSSRPTGIETGVEAEEKEFCEKWDKFYSKHKSGDFFKPRRYLTVEFGKYLSCMNDGDSVVEVGCGHGCSMFPIIESFPCQYIATDYSAEVLYILKKNENFDTTRCTAGLWDVTMPLSKSIWSQIHTPIKAVLAIFALSAVHPDYHVQCLINMRQLLENKVNTTTCTDTTAITTTTSGTSISTDTEQQAEVSIETHENNRKTLNNTNVILFRDYGIHDMTMYRHKVRYSETLYQRADHTLAYYFDLDYIQRIATLAGLSVLELEYATVRTENRRAKSTMHRVFVHAVLGLTD